MTLIAHSLCTCRQTAFACDSARSRTDPTGTTDIRKRWERQLVKRFRALKRLARQAIVQEDVLGLGKHSVKFEMLMNTVAAGFKRDASTPGPGAFAFNRSGDKVSAFMDWLKAESRRGILEISQGASMQAAANSAWQNTYIDSAYQKGIRDAYNEVSSRGGDVPNGGDIYAAFNQPVHADRVGLIYTRSFSDLEGIATEMDKQISRVLARGMAEGRGPLDIARELDDRIESIGITRARMLARTETIAAHADATLNSYEEADIQGVTVMAEFSTAGDDQVCPDCEELEGKEMEIDEARGLIPLHPNCRCTYLPVVS